MRIFVMILITLINLIVQSTFGVYFSPIFILPNTMLVIVLSYSIARNDIEGAIFGFVNGLIYDILFGRVIGFYALLCLVTAYLSAKPFKELSPNNFLIATAMIFNMSIFYNFMFYFFGYLFQGRVAIGSYFFNIILPESILNGLISFAIYPLIFHINRLLEEHEKPKRRIFGSVGGK